MTVVVVVRAVELGLFVHMFFVFRTKDGLGLQLEN